MEGVQKSAFLDAPLGWRAAQVESLHLDHLDKPTAEAGGAGEGAEVTQAGRVLVLLAGKEQLSRLRGLLQ